MWRPFLAGKSIQTRFVDHCTANTGVWMTCCISKKIANVYTDSSIWQNLRPTAIIAGAWSQSPECGAAAALSLAMSVSVLESSSKSMLKIAAVIGVSHAFCTCFVISVGIVVFGRAIQILFASITVWYYYYYYYYSVLIYVHLFHFECLMILY